MLLTEARSVHAIVPAVGDGHRANAASGIRNGGAAQRYLA
jgi:hypothetical protein